MSNELATQNDTRALNLEKVLLTGDLTALTPPERIMYINKVCTSLGLNPLTRPFEYQSFQGKCILYARKDCTEQLRKVHRISVTDLKSEVIGDLLKVTAYGRDGNGKEDLATGVVSIKSLQGEALANAHMKAETKAKRRFTLSICGLGILDETELENLTEASPTKAAQVNALLAEKKPEPDVTPEPDFAAENEPPSSDLGDYVIPIGKKYKGKRLADLSPETLNSFVEWVDMNFENKSSEVEMFLSNARAFLGAP